MSMHPADATTIGELGIDYLIDRTSIDRVQHTDDLLQVWALNALALGYRLRSMLRAAALLAGSDTWRDRLLGLVDDEPWRGAELAAMVLEREGAHPFDADVALTVQLHHDAQAVLDVLAVERQATTTPQGDLGVPLAAELLPRPSVPTRAPAGDGAVEVVEIGDLADPFSCRAHMQVYEELGELRDVVSWRWLYCATLRTLPASHRAGAIPEQVLDVAPDAFWPVVGTLAAEGLQAGVEHAQSALAEAGADPALGLAPPDGTPLPPGLLRDRIMSTVCGLPPVRPLFVVGRTLFVGTDAAPRIRAFIEAQTKRSATRP
jgi:hypothetical protein